MGHRIPPEKGLAQIKRLGEDFWDIPKEDFFWDFRLRHTEQECLPKTNSGEDQFGRRPIREKTNSGEDQFGKGPVSKDSVKDLCQRPVSKTRVKRLKKSQSQSQSHRARARARAKAKFDPKVGRAKDKDQFDSKVRRDTTGEGNIVTRRIRVEKTFLRTTEKKVLKWETGHVKVSRHTGHVKVSRHMGYVKLSRHTGYVKLSRHTGYVKLSRHSGQKLRHWLRQLRHKFEKLIGNTRKYSRKKKKKNSPSFPVV